jgi:hypothetical protein
MLSRALGSGIGDMGVDHFFAMYFVAGIFYWHGDTERWWNNCYGIFSQNVANCSYVGHRHVELGSLIHWGFCLFDGVQGPRLGRISMIR